MTGVQMFILMLAAVNVGLALAMGDSMTWRTHRWGPQLRVMVCGLVACGCGWLAWVGMDLEFALCAQVVVLATLLHASERVRIYPRHHWRESRLQEVQSGDRHVS